VCEYEQKLITTESRRSRSW